MFSAIAALIQFILALFRRAERKDMEEAGRRGQRPKQPNVSKRW